MSSVNIKKALSDTLWGLTRSQRREFFFWLRVKETVPTYVVDDFIDNRDATYLTHILVLTLGEFDAFKVVQETLREIGCYEEAESLEDMVGHGSSSTRSKQLKEELKEELKEDSTQSDFEPEVSTECGNTSYRFKFPGPGVFHCTLTGLVFTVVQEGAVLYRTVQWDEVLLHSAGKSAAGPLFSIECPENAIHQLHFPHCEPNAGCQTEGLSVAHITDEGVSFLKPLEITETHVVVKIDHLSVLGLVWDYIKRALTLPISVQVLLFLRPPNKKKRQKLHVFLLPKNVPRYEVEVQQENAQFIQTTSHCQLTSGQRYSLHCHPEPYLIQPKDAIFDLNYGPNYDPTFEIVVEKSKEEMMLTVRDQEMTEVWRFWFDLTDLEADPHQQGRILQHPPNLSHSRLQAVKHEFISRVSEPVLDTLLEKLLEREVINERERRSARAKPCTQRAEELIDMVINKGPKASSLMISIFCQEDPYLSSNLNLN